jgi:hypothetical protein
MHLASDAALALKIVTERALATSSFPEGARLQQPVNQSISAWSTWARSERCEGTLLTNPYGVGCGGAIKRWPDSNDDRPMIHKGPGMSRAADRERAEA